MTVTIEHAQNHLLELIAKLERGEELHIHQMGKPIAKLIRESSELEPRTPGSAAHIPHWMSPDFDAPLEDFKEYME